MQKKIKKIDIPSRLATFIIEKPLYCIGFILILSMISIYGIKFLKGDFSAKIWFRPDDPYLTSFEDFEKRFGSNDTVLIVVHHKDGIFNKNTLKLIQNITEEMWMAHNMMRVDSITNYNWAHAEADDLIVEAFIPEYQDEITPELLENRKKLAIKDPKLKNFLISKDLKTAVIYGQLKPVFEKEREYENVINDVESRIKKYQQNDSYGHIIHTTGWVKISVEMKRIAVDDLLLILPILFIVISVILTYIFKSFFGFLLPMIVIFLGISTSCGIAGWFGVTFNTVTSCLPSILLAISIADSVHLLTTFVVFMQEGMKKKDAIFNALKKNIRPTSLTTLSTSVGFLSLTATDLVPISNLGFMAGFGAIIIWMLTIFLLMPLLLFLPFRVSSKKHPNYMKKNKFFSKFESHNLSLFINKNRITLIIIFLVVTLISANLAFRCDVNSSMLDYFDDDLEVMKSTQFLQDNMGGIGDIQILVDSGEKEGVKNPEFLRKVDNFENWLNSQPYITKVSSLVGIVKQTNQALNWDDPAYYKIPDSKDLIAQEILLFSLGLPQGMGLNYWKTTDNRILRLNIRWNVLGSKNILEKVAILKEKAPEFKIKTKITGNVSLFLGLNDYIIQTFYKSMFMAIILISIMMAIIFKSLLLGLISMLPNIIPPLCGLSLMYISGISVDIGTVLITSVCLGITVDDTIYFLSDYSYLKEKGYSAIDAIPEVFSHSGRALIFTTIILVFGFGTFVLGSLIPNVNFGVITAFVLFIAIITDLILLPAILLTIGSRQV
ncbi:RND transporter [Candidatus Magnetomorum sp. HK-1]|nr:RND transporter [Candidatus Magnetomorum sp. HK-1]